MKKIKTVAFAMVAAVAMVGAGYAAWGTKITDSTTLNTGHWEVVLENDAVGDSLVAGDKVYNYNNTAAGITETGVASTDGYNHYDAVDQTGTLQAKASKVNGTNYVYTIAPTISGDKKAVSFKFYNMHPGTEAITRFEIRNKGTIPAKVAGINVKLNGGTFAALTGANSEFANAIQVNGTFYKHNGSNPAQAIGSLPAGTTLANLDAKLFDLLKNVQLQPMEYINSFNGSDEMEVSDLNFKLPASALSGNKGMDASLPIDIEFDFEQYNQNVPATPSVPRT